MQKRRWMLAGTAVIVAFAAVAVAYALLVPPLQNADEMYHLHYAQLIANHAQLPGGHMTEKQQPPLYYLMGALILKAGGSLTALRLMSVALGTATIALVMAVARELVPGRPGIALSAGVIAASLPISVAVSASFSDDVLAWAAGAALMWCAIRVLRSDVPSRGLLIVCGVVAGIGLLSKETDWLLVAALAVAIGIRLPRPVRIAPVAAATVPALAIAGWWFVRNLVVFHNLTPPLQPLTAPIRICAPSRSSRRSSPARCAASSARSAPTAARWCGRFRCRSSPASSSRSWSSCSWWRRGRRSGGGRASTDGAGNARCS